MVGLPIQGTEYLATRELLECGHARPVRTDIFGATNAVRRRCSACAVGTDARAELLEVVGQARGMPAGQLLHLPDPMKTGFKNVSR